MKAECPARNLTDAPPLGFPLAFAARAAAVAVAVVVHWRCRMPVRLVTASAPRQRPADASSGVWGRAAAPRMPFRAGRTAHRPREDTSLPGARPFLHWVENFVNQNSTKLLNSGLYIFGFLILLDAISYLSGHPIFSYRASR